MPKVLNVEDKIEMTDHIRSPWPGTLTCLEARESKPQENCSGGVASILEEHSGNVETQSLHPENMLNK